MPPFVQSALSQVRGFWFKRTVAQRVLVGGLAASVVLAFVFMVYWLNKPDWKILSTRLFPEDASRVVQLLDASKIPYQLEDGGTTIMVPAEQVYDARLKVAGEGVVHGQGLGFELFDDVKIGQTDFVQHINYQRALQGELSRTIAEFPEIDRARVHLVVPAKSLFIEEDMPATASVILQLKQGQTLSQKQLLAIINLVASSVEGLDKSRITIADTRGQVLFQPEADDSVQGMTLAQADHKTTMERNIESRIEQLLMPIVGGPEKVIARVNADLDFSHKTITKELYDPESAVIRSEQRSQEETKGSANLDGGAPDPNFRGDSMTGSLSSQQSQRETRTTNYEINKEQQQIVGSVGEIRRLSIAVIVDGKYAQVQGDAQPTFEPRTAEEIERIRQLVQNAVGFDTARGDSIEVSSVSFGLPETGTEQNLLATMIEYMQRLGKPFLNGVLIFLFLILVVRPVIMTLIKPRVAEQDTEEMVGLPSGGERLALEEGVEEEVLDLQRRLELAKAQAMQLSEHDMDQAVALLKNWIKQEA